jgi:hypothetical protein
VRRLGRILRGALTILSILLCLASVAMWVRGYWRWDVVGWTRPVRHDAETHDTQSGFFYVWSSGGGVVVYGGYCSPDAVRRLLVEGWYWNTSGRATVRYAGGLPTNRWGMKFETLRRAEIRWVRIIFPAWSGAAVFALPSITRVALWVRRRRRKREGHCMKCGYDLRATPERCPECGTAPAGLGH